MSLSCDYSLESMRKFEHDNSASLCASSPLCDIQLVWQYMCVALTVKHNYLCLTVSATHIYCHTNNSAPEIHKSLHGLFHNSWDKNRRSQLLLCCWLETYRDGFSKSGLGMRRIHHFQSETKLQSTEWNHTISSRQLPQYSTCGNCLPGHAEGDCGQYYRERNNKHWGKCCYPAQNWEVQEEKM